MRAEREPNLLELIFWPFLVLANSGTRLFRTSMKRFSPTAKVGSKTIALTLLFLI